MEDFSKNNVPGGQAITVQSPGRINIIGEHTDYNDGFVLPAAVDKKMVLNLKKNSSATKATLSAANLGESFSFDVLNFSPQPGGWQNYLLGVLHELQKLGAKTTGFDAVFEGNIPIGGGMSSSAALECSFAYALNELFSLGLETSQLIKAAQMAEHNFVGIKCGIMDQFASMMGKKDQVLLLDCRSLDHQYFPLDLDDHQILLLNSNVSHSLASSEYNTRRAECEEGVSLLKKHIPGIFNLRDVSLTQLNNHHHYLPDRLFRRCHHVVSENKRVLDATEAIRSNDLSNLGVLIYQSHFSLQNDYDVSCPELDYLVQQTLDKPYVLGSRMMGGGFGGCTINIVEKNKIDEFVGTVSKGYRSRFGIELTPYSITIEDGTSAIS